MKNIDPIDPPVDPADEWDRRNYSINLDDHRQIYAAKQVDVELNKIWKTIDRHIILFFLMLNRLKEIEKEIEKLKKSSTASTSLWCEQDHRRSATRRREANLLRSRRC